MKTEENTAPEEAKNVESSAGDGSGYGPFVFWGGLGLVCTGLIAISILFNSALKNEVPQSTKLPRLYQIHGDLEATERSGKSVRLSGLEGKVRVFAYIYTVCPHGCAATVGEMLKLQQAYGHRQDFQQVSITVLPERDTPATLAAFAEGIGLKPDSPWWFLTGDQARLWSFMTEQLHLNPAVPVPEDERLNVLDFYAHDLRLVLVDRKGTVRGYYSVYLADADTAALMRQRLGEDVKLLLDNPSL